MVALAMMENSRAGASLGYRVLRPTNLLRLFPRWSYRFTDQHCWAIVDGMLELDQAAMDAAPVGR